MGKDMIYVVWQQEMFDSERNISLLGVKQMINPATVANTIPELLLCQDITEIPTVLSCYIQGVGNCRTVTSHACYATFYSI